MTIIFGEWIKKELKKRDWNQAELARRGNISPSQITRAVNGERGIGIETLAGISKAFRMSSDTVIAAWHGKRTEEIEYIPLLDEWDNVFYELTPEDQQEILEIARMKANKRKVPVKITSRREIPARSALIDK